MIRDRVMYGLVWKNRIRDPSNSRLFFGPQLSDRSRDGDFLNAALCEQKRNHGNVFVAHEETSKVYRDGRRGIGQVMPGPSVCHGVEFMGGEELTKSLSERIPGAGFERRTVMHQEDGWIRSRMESFPGSPKNALTQHHAPIGSSEQANCRGPGDGRFAGSCSRGDSKEPGEVFSLMTSRREKEREDVDGESIRKGREHVGDQSGLIMLEKGAFHPSGVPDLEPRVLFHRRVQPIQRTSPEGARGSVTTEDEHLGCEGHGVVHSRF